MNVEGIGVAEFSAGIGEVKQNDVLVSIRNFLISKQQEIAKGPQILREPQNMENR